MILRSLASLAVRVGGAAASFAFQVLLARLLGPSHLGVYHTANAVSQLIAVLGRRGLDNVVVKHVSIAHSNSHPGQTRAVAAAALRVVVTNTSVLALLMIVLTLLAGHRWLAHDNAVPSLVVFVLAALPLGLVAIYGEALKSVGRVQLSASVQGLAIPILNLAAVAVLGAHVASAAAASWVFLVSALLAAALGAFAWRSALAGMAQGPGRCDPRRLSAEARPFFVAAIASVLCGSADILVLSVFANPEEVGIYAVASRIAVLFALVSLGVNGVVGPRFAHLASGKDMAALRALSRDACLLTAGVGLPVLLVCVLAPAWVLGLFGPQFTEGVLVLQLVVAGRYVSLASGPLGHLFQLAGRPGIERNLLVAAAVVVTGLSIPLTIRYGATGTAVAACVAWAGLGVSRIVVAVILFRSRLW